MTALPFALICGLASFLACQGWKIVRPVFSGRPPHPAEFFRSGGMPSAHTAFSASVAFAAGFREGFGSSLFAVAAVLTAIVAHDAVKVRGTMDSVIIILRKTVSSDVIEESGGLPESIGHSIAEIAVGLAVAAAIATGLHFLLP